MKKLIDIRELIDMIVSGKNIDNIYAANADIGLCCKAENFPFVDLHNENTIIYEVKERKQ